MKLLIGILVLQAFLVTFTKSQEILKAAYGENCTREFRCDSRKFLSCYNDQCECLMSGSMIYDVETEKCVALSGERCQYTTNEAEKSWMEEVPCTLNARCTNGICECNSGHYEIPNGTCLLKCDYGTECFSNKMCDNAKHLSCSPPRWTCDCVFNRVLDEDICKIIAGNRCSPNDNCVKFAECEGGVCTCVEEYFPNEEGMCKPKSLLGESCKHSGQCITYLNITKNSEAQLLPSHLQCVQRVCKCNTRTSMETTDANGTRYCGRLLGQPCSRHECVGRAVCNKTCECIPSDFESANHTCEPKKQVGESCMKHDECKSPFACSAAKQKCSCEVGFGFSITLNRCVTIAGGMCKFMDHDFEDGDCVFNARCVVKEKFPPSPSICECQNGTQASSLGEGYCYIPYNESCNGNAFGKFTTRQCLPGLTCRNGICTCPYQHHQEFDNGSNKCSSLVGGPCKDNEDCQDKNADCVLEYDKKQCRCKAGFTPSNRQCRVSYGQKCQSKEEPVCDQLAGLECGEKQICECPELQVYDNKTLSCRGLSGARCTVKSELKAQNFCTKDAICKPFRGFETVFGLCSPDIGNVMGRKLIAFLKKIAEKKVLNDMETPP